MRRTPSPLTGLIARCLVSTLVLTSVSPGVLGQIYVYALNSQGKVNVNAVQITKLSGGVKVQDITTILDLKPNLKVWDALAIEGEDWWVLRTDGKLSKSGAKVADLSFDSIFDAFWIDLTVFDESQWCLRTDGRINVDGSNAVTFSEGSYFFTRITNDGTNAWSLRSDGRVHRGVETPALFRFDAPNRFGNNDGDSTITEWIGLTVNPQNGNLYGLRRDGYIAVADPSSFGDKAGAEGGPPAVPWSVELPFPGSHDNVDVGNIYQALKFFNAGSWLALRGNGEVFEESDPVTPLVDLPGDPSDPDGNSVYESLLIFDGEFLSLRQDGKIYQGVDRNVALELPGGSYRTLAFGNTFPNLANVKTKAPVVTKYTVKGVAGDSFAMPLLVIDVDTPPSEVVVTVDETTVPSGAVYDSKSRTLTWDDPEPAGKYKLAMTADNGVNKPVNKSFKISLVAPNTNPSKNIKPVAAKIKHAMALDNEAYSLPLLVFDADGDEVAVSADTSVYPYTAGATFDVDSKTFMWTPALSDVGKVKLRFSMTDGTATRSFKVTLQVVSSLITYP
ncbi:MAG: hypothetical protein P8N09_08715 [Planctomycetota bacterium]|nr:hypothetical protein [Planctomycetota bacterium]